MADALAKFLKIHAREVSFAGQKTNMLLRTVVMRSRAVQGNARSERLQLEGCRAGVCAAQAQAAFRRAEGNAFTTVLREVSNRDDVEQRLIDICVKGVPNYFGAQRFGIGGSNLQGRSAGRKPILRCAIAINGVLVVGSPQCVV